MRSNKDLQLVNGQVIPAREKTAKETKEHKIGKAAYNPVVKDFMDSRPTLEKVDEMINEPMKRRGKQIDFVQLFGKVFRKPQTKK